MFNDYKDRPRIKVKKEQLDYILESIAWLGWLAMIILPAIYYQELPDQVPTHFNATGEADAWGGKMHLLLLPLIGSVLFFGMIILNNYPHIFNLPVKITEENAEKQYRSAQRLIRSVNISMMLIFPYLIYGSIQNALGNMNGLGSWTLPIILILSFLPIGIYFFQQMKK